MLGRMNFLSTNISANSPSINTYKQREDKCKETLDNLLKEHPNQNNNDDALAYENEIKAKTLRIQELTKEYMAYIKDSKRQNQEIRRLRKEIEYNANYDRILTLHRLIEEEQIKHNELTLQLRALNIVNTNKLPNVNEYESGSSLESEIEQIKHSIKQYQDKHTKQERFLNLIHEKIISIEMTIKHMKEDKQLKQKQFTQEQLQHTLDEINMLNKKIEENRNMLNNINRNSTLKMKNLMEKNKEIETEFMRNQKENRKLMFKKNELKRKIRLIEEGDIEAWIKMNEELIEDCKDDPSIYRTVSERMAFSIKKGKDLLSKWTSDDFRKVIKVANQVKQRQLSHLINVFINPDDYSYDGVTPLKDYFVNQNSVNKDVNKSL